MGIEGSVKAGFKKELAAISDPVERENFFNTMVAEKYDKGKAINMAAHMEIDTVIDPADTRRWIVRGLCARSPQPQKKPYLPMIDSW
jgi:acetyl-CoA carboxylase carboxyltransferase component